MIDNEQATAINPGEVVEEMVSCRTASAFGSAFTLWTRTPISTWCWPMPNISGCLTGWNCSNTWLWNGQCSADRVRGERRGNSFKACRLDGRIASTAGFRHRAGV